MVSETTRTELWNHIVNAERNCRYYEVTSTKMLRRYIGLRLTVLVFFVGGLLAIPEALGFAIQIRAGIAAGGAALLIWEVVLNYPKRSFVATMAHSQLAQARSQLRDLWLSVDREDSKEHEVRQRLREVARQADEVEQLAGIGELPVDNKTNEKAARDATQVLKHRYFPPGYYSG